MTPSEEFMQIQRDLLVEIRQHREKTADLARALRFCGWIGAIAIMIILGMALKH